MDDFLRSLREIDEKHFAVITDGKSKVYDSDYYEICRKPENELPTEYDVEKIRTKDIGQVTREEFLALPHAKWDESVEGSGLVIIPTKEKHDSGYLCMYYCVTRGHHPYILVGGGSDIIDFENYWHLLKDNNNSPFTTLDVTNNIPFSWKIDCLPYSGLLHVFSDYYNIVTGASLSSMTITPIKR